MNAYHGCRMLFVQKVILLLVLCAHTLTAVSKSNVSKVGPSDDKRINMSNVVVLSRFLESLLILFMVEKPLSQSAVEIGSVREMLANLERVG